MDFEKMAQNRKMLNALMAQEDNFYKEFSELDDQVYAKGAISKKHKELMGLAISVATRCDECIAYHISGCIESEAGKSEILEALRIGSIAGGSITYPNVRFAFSILKEKRLIECGS